MSDGIGPDSVTVLLSLPSSNNTGKMAPTIPYKRGVSN